MVSILSLSNISLIYLHGKYTVDNFWGQLIKLIQFVSTSYIHEYWWNNIDLFIFVSWDLVQGLST